MSSKHILFNVLCCAKSLQSSLTLCDTMDYNLPGSSVHGDSSGKNTRVGFCGLLQGIFLTQGWNLCLLHLLQWQVGSLPLKPPGKPILFNTHIQKQWKNFVTMMHFYSRKVQLKNALHFQLLNKKI